jgi:Ca-activated chloride channel family protein
VTGEERPGALVAASTAVLHLPTAGDGEEGLFLRRLLLPQEKAASKAAPSEGKPIEIAGGDPGLRDVYPVLVQPPQPGSLSGWIGRYSRPAAKVSLSPRGLPGSSLTVSFPDSDLEARDLPRRWARARVDHLLELIERDGEKRSWIDEIVELSRRFKFVTPYTAFLAAPRSLLRPRRIQPGDPVIRVEADPGTVRAAALLPFGRRVELVRRPRTNLWEGRFLVPDGTADGPMVVKIVLTERSGASVVETKRLVVDGTAPTVLPDPAPRAAAGGRVRVSARSDSDTVFLSVRLGDGPPVPLRWEPGSLRSVAEVPVPDGPSGRRELFFEASDAAGNHGFARSTVEVTR